MIFSSQNTPSNAQEKSNSELQYTQQEFKLSHLSSPASITNQQGDKVSQNIDKRGSPIPSLMSDQIKEPLNRTLSNVSRAEVKHYFINKKARTIN